MPLPFNRRKLLAGFGASAAAAALKPGFAQRTVSHSPDADLPLSEVRYDQVAVRDPRHLAQSANVLDVLTHLSDDGLLYPFRAMSGSGETPPGVSLGGWFEWNPHYNHHHSNPGLAPGHALGQWTSALARFHAASRFGNATGDNALADQATRLHAGLAQCIGPRFFEQTRFPAYTLDKLACGLVDGHRLLRDPNALPALNRIVDAALPSLPSRALDRETQWKLGAGIDWMWDESYTLPENFFLGSRSSNDPRLLQLARQYLDDSTFFAPLARAENVLGDHHAYSYVNALSSAMQAYLTGGSAMHLQAAINGFHFLEAQSFATGGWGPEETLRAPGYDELFKSLSASRNSFETPCGSYAHSKLTRYLLRATGDSRYGDSMERVLLNTVSGALPLQADGRSFYSQDCTYTAKRIYSEHRWPCCSGTLPQVIADHGINTFFQQPGALQQSGALWVNLYHASELRFTERSASITLTQTGPYLEQGRVELRVTPSIPTFFAIRVRVPAWAGAGASLRVNGRALPLAPQRGFATIERTWKAHDTLELDFAPFLHLEPFPANGAPAHPELAALMWGPLVLFAVREPAETGPLAFTSETLLKATRLGPLAWSALDAKGVARRFLPFFDIADQTYSTYLQILAQPL